MDLVIYVMFSLILIDVIYDFYKIEIWGRQIKHLIETIDAALSYLIALSLLIFIKSITIYQGAAIGVLILPYRWIFHDLLLNLLRGKRLDYLGSDHHSAVTDKVLNILSLKGANQWVIKSVALLLGNILALIITFIGMISNKSV